MATANATTTAELDQLCTATIHLASDVDDQGTSPKPPFQSTHKTALNSRAKILAAEYIRLAGLASKHANAGAVKDAQHAVAAVQAVMDVINTALPNSFSAAGVLSDIDAAIGKIGSV